MSLNKTGKSPDGSGPVQTSLGTGGDAGPLPEGPRSVVPAPLGIGQAPVRDIDVPAEAFPNILQGQRLLAMTTKQWHHVYHHVQDIIRVYFLASEATREATYGNNPENHNPFILPIEARFPVLRRCKDNWGVKWIIKKAKHAVSVKFSHERREECLQMARHYEKAREILLEMKQLQQETIEDGDDDGGGYDSDVVVIGQKSVKPAGELVPRGGGGVGVGVGVGVRQQYMRPHPTRPTQPLQTVPNSNNQRMNQGSLVPRENSRERQQYAVEPHSTVADRPNTNKQRMNPEPILQAPNAQLMLGLESTSEAPKLPMAYMLPSRGPSRSPSTKRVNAESIRQLTGLSSAQLVSGFEATRQVPGPSSPQFADLGSDGEGPGSCCYRHMDQEPSYQRAGPLNVRPADIESNNEVSRPCCDQYMNVEPSHQGPKSSNAQFISGLESTHKTAGHAPTTLSSRPVPSNPLHPAFHPIASAHKHTVISGVIGKRPALPPIRASIPEAPPARVIPGLVLPSIAEVFPEFRGEVGGLSFPASDPERMACDAMLRENGSWLAGPRRDSRAIWK